MAKNPEPTSKNPQRLKRRRWSWSFKIRLALALLLLLGLAGWRYGWPPRSWESTICFLDEIDWEEAVRLTPGCTSTSSVNGARCVRLTEGSLDKSGSPVFDVKRTWNIYPAITPLWRDILPKLQLPDLESKRFRAGVFWIDMPAEYEGEPADAIDPAEAYSVLLMCEQPQRWEKGAELIVDINRNRDLTDDPVMTLSDIWSHGGVVPHAELAWFVRVFNPLALSRTSPRQGESEAFPATVETLPALNVSYYEGEELPNRVYLAFYPTLYRRGQLAAAGVMRDVVIAPDRTRFGRFDGPIPVCWPIDGRGMGRSIPTTWKFERGAFWGGTLDIAGREFRDGPYQGPMGNLSAETAHGEPLRTDGFKLWLRGKDPHGITSKGWAPIPRFSSSTFPVDEHPLPIGDYGITRLSLARGRNCLIEIEMKGHRAKPSPRQFSIRDGETTRLHLPKKLEFEVFAAIDVESRPYWIEQIWSSKPGLPDDESNAWKGPRPGCKVTLSAQMSDPATGNQYSIDRSGNASRDAIRLVIKNEAGKTVHQDTMEYG